MPTPAADEPAPVTIATFPSSLRLCCVIYHLVSACNYVEYSARHSIVSPFMMLDCRHYTGEMSK